MKPPVNQYTFVRITAVVLLMGNPGTSSADEESRWHPGWIPSLSIHSGIIAQDQFSDHSSECENGGFGPASGGAFPLPNCLDPNEMVTAPLREPDRGTDQATTPIVGGSLQLMTPVISTSFGGPRLFGAGEIMAAFPPQRFISSEGDASFPELPMSFSQAPSQNDLVSTRGLIGVGGYTASEIETFVWGARAGIALPFRFRERTFWIKPAAAWTRYSVKVEGFISAGLKDDLFSDNDANDAANGGPQGEFLRTILLRDSAEQSWNAVGPAVELEMAVGRFGPIGASLFAGFAAYKVLGNRKVELSDSVTVTPDQDTTDRTDSPDNGLAADTYNARWNFEVDDWLYRGSLGFRFSWLGHRADSR